MSLKDRLNRVDAVAPEEPDQVQGEAPEPANNQQELLRMVKEVAKQREMGGLRELEEDNQEEEEEKHGFWGSKSGKRFGLF